MKSTFTLHRQHTTIFYHNWTPFFDTDLVICHIFDDLF